MIDESRLSTLANELLDSHVMQYKAGIDGGGGSKSLPGHPAEQIRDAYEELKQAGLVEAVGTPSRSTAVGRWGLTPKGRQLVSCAVADQA